MMRAIFLPLIILELCVTLICAQDACDACLCYKRNNEKYVDCTGNGLTTIPTGIPDDTVHLLLQDNDIEEVGYINSTLGQISRLKKLFLHNNNISKIAPDAFAGVQNIDTLLLHFNSIQNISSAWFKGLRQLEWLWLNNNDASVIHDDAFLGLTNLRELYLQNNRFQNLHTLNMTDLVNLKHLYTTTDFPIVDPTCCTFCGLPSTVDISWGDIPGPYQLSNLNPPQQPRELKCGELKSSLVVCSWFTLKYIREQWSKPPKF